MLKVLVVPVGEAPRVQTIDRGLAPMQQLVGGYIEAIPLAQNVDAFCNEEGRLQGLPRNRWVERIQGYVCGAFFISRHDEEGNAVDLTPSDIKRYKKEFALGAP